MYLDKVFFHKVTSLFFTYIAQDIVWLPVKKAHYSDADTGSGVSSLNMNNERSSFINRAGY